MSDPSPSRANRSGPAPAPSAPDAGDRHSVPLRLSVSLPGSASLGAYQAGALSAVAVLVEELRRSGRDVRVDALGGVSAGAIVSLFYAHSLLTGSDAPSLLRRAWVDDVSASLLRSRSDRSPLDFSRLEPQLRELLGRPAEGHDDDLELRRQRSPIGLHIGLTNLLGLTYTVDTGGTPLNALSFVDWGRFLLDPDGGPEQLVQPVGRSPLDYALASAAHPLAFAPRMLDRSDDRAGYERQGITNLPEVPGLWYSDGGLVESEPVGRTLAAAHTVAAADESEGTRLHLVIDPRSSGPSGSQRWADPDEFPSWVAGVRRAMSVLPSQSLHEDLRQVAVANHRLKQVDDLVQALAPVLSAEDADVWRCLVGLAEEDQPVDDAAPLDQVLRRGLQALAGVTGKERVRVDAISPLLLAREGDSRIPGLLAGDIMGAFGGFLSRRLRESDYTLGWDSTLAWTHDGFRDLALDDETVAAIHTTLEERRGPSWDEVNAGAMEVGRLGRSARLELARIALHVGRIIAVELLPATIAGRVRRSSRAHDEPGVADEDIGGADQDRDGDGPAAREEA